MALAHSSRRAAVLGCGSPGLTAARQLQRRGFDVTIYAATIPPDTTSNLSMAGFTPITAIANNAKRTPAWDAQFRKAAEISYKELQTLVGSPEYGVSRVDSYFATDDRNARPGEGRSAAIAAASPAVDLLPAALRPERDRVVLGPGEHPFPTKFAVKTSALAIEPSVYLEALVRDFVSAGGQLVIRKFDTPRDLMTLDDALVVNCTGLGSKTLFNDTELEPIKGQYTVCEAQPEVDYRVSGRLPGAGPVAAVAAIASRRDGLLVGNMMERGNGSLEPNDEVRKLNMEAAMRFVAGMRG